MRVKRYEISFFLDTSKDIEEVKKLLEEKLESEYFFVPSNITAIEQDDIVAAEEVFTCPQCGETELKDEKVYIKGVGICRGCVEDV